jgi:hypothetical protein
MVGTEFLKDVICIRRDSDPENGSTSMETKCLAKWRASNETGARELCSVGRKVSSKGRRFEGVGSNCIQ